MDLHRLDRIFSALSDATRRGILAELATGERTVKELCEPFDMSQPAISKHLRVLDRAGLIRREKRGRENFVSAQAEAADHAAAWIQHYSRFWRHHFDQVADHLAQKKGKPHDN